MLQPIDDYNQFKEKFRIKFHNILDLYPDLRSFFYEIFFEGTAYVVGGFLRDLANGKDPRDLDIILKIPPNKISKLLLISHLDYKLNRMGGAKIFLDNFEIDLWSIENNWGFKTGLIKMNEQYIVDNIASGCFYNFDSLVINVHKSMELSVKNYNESVNNKELDILRRGVEYKKLNPTIEANILKAFYIKKRYNFSFSESCSHYLISRLLFLQDNYESTSSRLLAVKKQYPKYNNALTDSITIEYVNELLKNNNTSSLFGF